MSVTTVKLDDLEKYVDNIYEAIVIIAKRAKQINNEQKRIFETEVTLDEETDEYDDDDIETENDDEPQYIKLPKPTKIALEELLTGQIKFEYLDREENS